MATATKDQILGFKTSDIVNVPAPEFGDGVVIRMKAVSGADFENWLAEIRDGAGKVSEKNLMVRTIALCACDDDGVLMFGPAELPALNKLPRKVLNRLFAVARKQAGLTDDEKADLVGKSEASPA